MENANGGLCEYSPICNPTVGRSAPGPGPPLPTSLLAPSVRPPASPHRATPTALPAPNESHAGSRHHAPGAHLTTGPGLEQRRHTSGDALKGAGRVGRAAFTAALRRWHLVILAGDVYRGNVGRRTRWVRALPSHSYQCASRPRRRPAGRRASCHAAPAVAPGHASFPRMAGHRAPDPDPRASGDVDQVRTKHHRGATTRRPGAGSSDPWLPCPPVWRWRLSCSRPPGQQRGTPLVPTRSRPAGPAASRLGMATATGISLHRVSPCWRPRSAPGRAEGHLTAGPVPKPRRLGASQAAEPGHTPPGAAPPSLAGQR